MGFVTKVEDAPAVIEAIVRASHLFSAVVTYQQGSQELAEHDLPMWSFKISLVDSYVLM